MLIVKIELLFALIKFLPAFIKIINQIINKLIEKQIREFNFLPTSTLLTHVRTLRFLTTYSDVCWYSAGHVR